jgi:hypothetical protein
LASSSSKPGFPLLKVLADDLLRPISFNPFRALIPADDSALFVKHQDRVVLHIRHHQPEPLLTLRQTLFRLLAHVDLAGEHRHKILEALILGQQAAALSFYLRSITRHLFALIHSETEDDRKLKQARDEKLPALPKVLLGRGAEPDEIPSLLLQRLGRRQLLPCPTEAAWALQDA